MRLLILGGSRFLGRHLVQEALDRGHRVTTFHRGRRTTPLDDRVERLIGDRRGDLSMLDGRCWDAVIDTCGFVPSAVRAMASRLAESVGHYTFISSISVYEDFAVLGRDETAPVGRLSEMELEEAEAIEVVGDVSAPTYRQSYGPLKALCEQAAEQILPGRVLHLRPGLLVGPLDYTGRLSYWPQRIARGGEVLAPGAPDRRVQFVDARDVATFLLDSAEKDLTGVFNVTGPEVPLTFEELLETCREVTGSSAQWTWVGDEFLEEAEVVPTKELPLWLPAHWEGWQGFHSVSIARAQSRGLRYRPLKDTLRDILEDSEAGRVEPEGVGLRPEREIRLLRRWHRSQG